MNRPALCTSCNRLMGTAEVCPYCGAKRSNVRLKMRSLTGQITQSNSAGDLIFKITGIMFALEILVGAFLFGDNLFTSILQGPSGRTLVFLGASTAYVFEGYWWGPLTATFLHGGILHFGMNMFAFKQISGLVEQVTSGSFLVVSYLLSGVCGFLLSSSFGNLSVGASAGLFGLIGCGMAISFFLGSGKDDPLFQSLSMWTIFGLVFGFLVPGIDNYAHIGGLVGGGFLGFIWSKRRVYPSFHQLVEKLAIVLAFATVAGFVHCVFTFSKELW